MFFHIFSMYYPGFTKFYPGVTKFYPGLHDLILIFCIFLQITGEKSNNRWHRSKKGPVTGDRGESPVTIYDHRCHR